MITEPWPWCEIPWAEVHAACRAGGYDPGTPAQRRAFLDGLPPGVTVEGDNETCWKMAGRWFSEFGQVTEREVEDWCADDACWPVEVTADDLRAWAVAALERCAHLDLALYDANAHAGAFQADARNAEATLAAIREAIDADDRPPVGDDLLSKVCDVLKSRSEVWAHRDRLYSARRPILRAKGRAEVQAHRAEQREAHARGWALAALERCRVLQAQLDSERRHADELVRRIGDVTEALGERRTPGRPLAEDVRELAESTPDDWREQRRRSSKTIGELTATLAAIREALGCEPGAEVESASLATHEALRWMRQALGHPFGTDPRPGDTLTADDFGTGEAGVLRLAALLAEAPEGAVVRDGGGIEWWRCGSTRWPWRSKRGVAQGPAASVARRAPLTVVAWPEGGAARPSRDPVKVDRLRGAPEGTVISHSGGAGSAWAGGTWVAQLNAGLWREVDTAGRTTEAAFTGAQVESVADGVVLYGVLSEADAASVARSVMRAGVEEGGAE